MLERAVTCPCGSGETYAVCCGPCLDAGTPAVTAEALMRSRYVAYVQSRADYLQRTWHASTRPPNLELTDAAGMKWLGLEILNIREGGEGDAAGEVEFVAHYKVRGRAGRLHEISRFIKLEGEWFYLEGDIDPCP